MHELRTVFSRQLRTVVGVAALGALVHLQVAAQTIPMPQRLDRFHVFADGNIVSAKYMNGYEGYGTRINLGLGVNGGATTGGVSLSKQLALNTKNGVVVAEAVQKISSRQIAKGFRAAARGPLGLALLAAPVVIDWLSDAGIEHEDGVFKAPPPLPAGYDGFEYKEQNEGFSIPWAKTKQLACEAHAARTYGGPSGNYYTCHNAGVHPNFQVALRYPNGSIINIQDRLYGRRTDPSPPSTEPVPIPDAELEDKLTAANPTPEVLKELADKGGQAPDPDPADTPKVQNPVQSQDKTTTKTNPDGSTETTVCRTSGTVVGDNLKLTEQCTITARDPAGNTTSTTTTDTDDAAPQAGTEQSMFCTLFPDILACAKFGEADEQVPTSTRNVTFAEENLFGGGTCPTDQTFTFKGSTIPITNYAQACDLLQTYVRPLAILLAFFTGLMIIARGMPE